MYIARRQHIKSVATHMYVPVSSSLEDANTDLNHTAKVTEYIQLTSHFYLSQLHYLVYFIVHISPQPLAPYAYYLIMHMCTHAGQPFSLGGTRSGPASTLESLTQTTWEVSTYHA